MEESQFWALIEPASRSATPDESTEKLREVLFAQSAETISEFQQQFDLRFVESYQTDVWMAAKLLNGGYCSDDGFEYFRYWLISQGEQWFNRALSEPDSLAELAVPMEGDIPDSSNEGFGYVTADVYKALTGKNLRGRGPSAIKRPTPPKILDISELSKEDFQQKLPRLWEKYGQHFDRADRSAEEALKRWLATTVDIPGLGTITAGTRVRHGFYGVGLVEWVNNEGYNPMAMIQFKNVRAAFSLSTAYFQAVADE